MHNDALYEYLKGDAWTRNDNQSFTIDYTENIAAAYAVASAQLGRWGLVAGLRGEYTHTTGKSVGQDYFSLFPNANVSFALSKEKGWSLIAQYARTIERPRFWCLNPQRMQISDYTYQTGNPSLDPAFKQDVNLTLVAAHKYTLTAGVQLVSGEIQQTIQADPENPDLLQLAWVNYDRTKNYYVSVNLPFQPAKWWQLNANFTYMRHGERVEQHGAETFYNWAFGSISTTFTLPAKFYIDLSYNYQSRIDLGNCWVEPDHRLQAGVKKRFGDRFTASFSSGPGTGDRSARRRIRPHDERPADVEQPLVPNRADLQLQVGEGLQAQSRRGGVGRRKEPAVTVRRQTRRRRRRFLRRRRVFAKSVSGYGGYAAAAGGAPSARPSAAGADGPSTGPGA